MEFAGTFDALRTAECRAGRPWGEILFHGLGIVRVRDGRIQVLFESNDVNNPRWEIAQVVRDVDGWRVSTVAPSGMYSAGDRCL